MSVVSVLPPPPPLAHAHVTISCSISESTQSVMSDFVICIVPPGKTFAELTEVDETLVRAQQLLTDGIPTGKGRERERFEYFVERASTAPFLALDRTQSDDRHWHQAGINVAEALFAILPFTIMKTLKEKSLPDIQAIMESTAKVSSFTTFFWAKDSGGKKLMEFAILRQPSWEVSTFEVYYVEIEAKFESSGTFGIYSTSYDLYANYCINQYSVLTSFLLAEMQVEPEKAKNAMEAWYKKTTPAIS